MIEMLCCEDYCRGGGGFWNFLIVEDMLKWKLMMNERMRNWMDGWMIFEWDWDEVWYWVGKVFIDGYSWLFVEGFYILMKIMVNVS